MKKLSWTWFDHSTDLPEWLTSGIGQIMVEWSVLERELEQIIHLLVDVDIGIARIVTHRMSGRTRVDTIRYLLEWHIYHDRLNSSYLEKFDNVGSRIATKTQPQRDMLAHGLWSAVDGAWLVLKQKGQRPTPELKPDLPKLSRTFLPQKEPISQGRLEEILREVVSDARCLQEFCEDVHGALSPPPSRYKPPQYTRRRPKIPKKKVRSAPPRS
jgi:hypothetical protein